MPILSEIENHRKIWQELFWNMADGDVLKYNEIKRLDAITEFWKFFDLWRERQNKKIEQARKQQSKKIKDERFYITNWH
jgi:coenzyme F420-reducing hydrogenase beta subunit